MRALHVALLAGLWTLPAQAELLPIPPPPGASDRRAYVTAVSADGGVAVGHWQGPLSNGIPFRWTRDTGAQELSNFSETFATGVLSATSLDGSVVYGARSNVPMRWTATHGVEELLQPGSPFPLMVGPVYSVTTDESIATGHNWRWTLEGGFELLDLGPNVQLYNLYVSDDGSTFAGNAGWTGMPFTAFLWREGEPVRLLTPPTGFTTISVVGLSGDGRVVLAGGSPDGPNSGPTRPFYWTSEEGFVELISPLPHLHTRPTGISGDGSRIVGDIGYRDGFVWIRGLGMALLREAIPEFGPIPSFEQPDGWSLITPTAISRDGQTIVGHGQIEVGKTIGFIASFPQCTNGRDDDGDGTVDGADAGCNLVQLERENPQCENGFDDDADGSADFPADAGCLGTWDDDESGNLPEVVCGLVGIEALLPLAALTALRRRRSGARFRPKE